LLGVGCRGEAGCGDQEASEMIAGWETVVHRGEDGLEMCCVSLYEGLDAEFQRATKSPTLKLRASTLRKNAGLSTAVRSDRDDKSYLCQLLEEWRLGAETIVGL
jgi:hypothetical protein